MDPQIWKWTLELTDEQVVMMPAGAEILSVGVQHEELRVWAKVDPGEVLGPRQFCMYGTGHPMQTELPQRFIGTVQMHGGCLVLHVYERLDTPASEDE
jgi:hypothetical protein